jgi:S-(hydroxymethyl)glutathione dehydrogenase/alcohol dehydrogenase
MLKNKIAVLTKINSQLKLINNINIPSLKRNQVLIKVIYTAVCGSQLQEISGNRDSKKYIPHALGHEASGYVIDKNKSVTKVKINDKVFISWISSNGKDALPPKYYFPQTKKLINCGKVATFSEFCIVPENKVYPLPKNLSLKDSVLLGCAIPTGAGMVINQSKISNKKKILILGLGGVGLSCLMAVKLKKNIYVDVYDKNINTYKIVKKFFSKITCLSAKNFGNIHEKIKKNKIKSYDYVFETSGNIKVLENSVYLINNTGKVIFASHPPKKKFIKIDPFELIKGKKIEGSWGGNTNFNKNIDNFVKLIKKNRKLINYLTNKSFNFNLINKAIRLMKNGKILRPIIEMKR